MNRIRTDLHEFVARSEREGPIGLPFEFSKHSEYLQAFSGRPSGVHFHAPTSTLYVTLMNVTQATSRRASGEYQRKLTAELQRRNKGFVLSRSSSAKSGKIGTTPWVQVPYKVKFPKDLSKEMIPRGSSLGYHSQTAGQGSGYAVFQDAVATVFKPYSPISIRILDDRASFSISFTAPHLGGFLESLDEVVAVAPPKETVEAISKMYTGEVEKILSKVKSKLFRKGSTKLYAGVARIPSSYGPPFLVQLYLIVRIVSSIDMYLANMFAKYQAKIQPQKYFAVNAAAINHSGHSSMEYDLTISSKIFSLPDFDKQVSFILKFVKDTLPDVLTHEFAHLQALVSPDKHTIEREVDKIRFPRPHTLPWWRGRDYQIGRREYDANLATVVNYWRSASPTERASVKTVRDLVRKADKGGYFAKVFINTHERWRINTLMRSLREEGINLPW